MSTLQPPSSDGPIWPSDGSGAGDHDQPYEFGGRPHVDAPYPFTTREYARLLVLRGRLWDRANRPGLIEHEGSLPPAA